MHDAIQSLTEREKETLRLLLGGHDAKSSAQVLGLSVHTVNERLRDARRKLGVSSSREAARRLAEAERANPDFLGPNFLGGPDLLGDNDFGVARNGAAVIDSGPSDQRPAPRRRFAWLAGGIVIMSLVIAIAVLGSIMQGSGDADAPALAKDASNTAPSSAVQSAAEAPAREWVALVDREQWQESWQNAAALFRVQVTAEQWTASVKPVRQPLGSVASRTLQSVTASNSLPGAPAGEYQVLQFQTRFAARPNSVETVVLAREDSAWKVVGYFIR